MRVDQNLRIVAVETVHADLREAAVLAVVLDAHPGLERKALGQARGVGPFEQAGELTLEVRALGYASGRMTVALERGETRELNFEVAQSGISMDEVVVSASRSETLRREAPALVSVLDAGLFERANACLLYTSPSPET